MVAIMKAIFVLTIGKLPVSIAFSTPHEAQLNTM
jgi:hypothetical protein